MTSFAAAVTSTVGAVLLLLAAVVIVVGLARAVLGRRRAQLVITDIAATDEVSVAVTAGLSSLLRQRVRRRLLGATAPSGGSLATVEGDLRGGLLRLPDVRPEDIGQMQRAILEQPREQLLSASAADDLAPVAGGIRAVVPNQADGILAVLTSVLPRQRGLVISSTVLSRAIGGLVQTGLSIDVGPLGRAPDASATFWSVGLSSDPGPTALAVRSELFDLLDPAAAWIVLRVTGMVGAAVGAGGRKGAAGRQALADILTSQVAGYYMARSHHRPSIALGFADQACEDAERAARRLPAYHRPNYLIATIHDHRAACYEAMAVDAAVAEPTRVVYDRTARSAYREAADHFAAAIAALQTLDAADSTARARAVLTSEIRQARALVKIGQRDGAVTVLARVPGALDNDAGNAYNAACVWSLLAVADGRQDVELLDAAAGYLCQAIAAAPDYEQRALLEEDLLAGFGAGRLADVLAGAAPPAG